LTPLLSGKDLCLIRGDNCLFKGVSFALNKGELLVVEGTNGSGKTSLLKSVAGLISLESGDIVWNGSNTRGGSQEFRSALAWFSHRAGLKGDLTPVENLEFESGLRAFRNDEYLEALNRVGVAHCASIPVRSLSAGQQRRVGLARMVLAAAPLWMLDEPFTNLDTGGQQLVRDMLGEHLARDGICIVATHQSVELDAPTHRVVL
jgi:heme exporter protein A